MKILMKGEKDMLKYSLKIFCVLFVICFAFQSNAQSFSEVKTINKTFPLERSTRISASNKYGIVHIVPWEKDSVKFEIRVSVSSDKNSKLTDILDDIWVNFSSDDYLISASTEIGRKKRNILSDFKKIAESLLTSQSNIQINYKIFLPVYIDIEIANKYGDVFIDDHKGDFKLNLTNGNFKAGELGGICDINFSFGSGNIQKLANAKLILLNAELDIQTSNQINIIDSRVSEIIVKDVEFLRVNSRRDKFYLTNVGSLFGKTDFTDISINRLNKEINTEMQYGSIVIGMDSPGFTAIDIESEFTDIYINYSPNVNYHSIIEASKIKLEVPEDIKVQEAELESSKNFRYIFTSKDLEDLPLIKINAIDCTIIFKRI